MFQFLVFLVSLVLIAFLISVVLRCIYILTNRDARSRTRNMLECLLWFMTVSAFIAAMFLPVRTPPEITWRSQCKRHLLQIMQAMHNYHDKYGCFPPSCTVDKNGRPLHSWRVLLLPFLEDGDIYQRLRLDQPYGRPQNLTVFDSIQPGHDGSPSMPFVFWCPADKESVRDTNYVMVLGPRTLSNGPNTVRLKDITDGPANTIAVVETCGLDIRWYEPRDLRVDEMSFKINDPEHFGIASRHPGGAQIAFVDGGVRFLADDVDPCMIEAMTTIGGGEETSHVLK